MDFNNFRLFSLSRQLSRAIQLQRFQFRLQKVPDVPDVPLLLAKRNVCVARRRQLFTAVVERLEQVCAHVLRSAAGCATVCVQQHDGDRRLVCATLRSDQRQLVSCASGQALAVQRGQGRAGVPGSDSTHRLHDGVCSVRSSVVDDVERETRLSCDVRRAH